MPLSNALVMTKVLSLYENLQKGYALQEGNHFSAALHNVKLMQLGQECALNEEAEEIVTEPQWGLTVIILRQCLAALRRPWSCSRTTTLTQPLVGQQHMDLMG